MSAPQQTIGHFRIVSKLGEGGMGEVWRATDTRLNREVAIKVLPEAFAADPMRMGRFAREAQVLASLNHPGIAAIYGVEERALVMELVEGPTLAEKIARSGMPIEDAWPIATQIAEALEYAHEKGVVHRDLKPANIKITPEGRVKILDFGLAKALQAEISGESSPSASAEAATLSSPATMAGTILGTAAYMSPEQARGQTVDRRADIWAFGVVLYEMLTGERPFGGPTISDALAAVLAREPELGKVPARARPVLEGCLRKDQRQRWQAIGDVRLALDGGLPTQAQAGDIRVPARWHERALWGGVVVLAVLVTFAATWWRMHRQPATPIVSRFGYPLPDGQSFTQFGRHVLAISPDGSKIVYVANRQLYLRAMNQLDGQAIRGTDEDPTEPVFSPDGQWIAYFLPGTPGTLRKVAVAGGAPITLCRTASGPFGVSWRNGTIAFGQYDRGNVDAIQSVPDTGGTPRTLVSIDPKDGRIIQPQLLDDGKHVLFTVLPLSQAGFGGDQGRIAVQATDGGARRVLFTGGMDPHLLPTNQLVYIHDSTLLAVPFDPKRLAVTGGPVPVVEGVSEYSLTGQFDISRDGTLAYWPGTMASAGHAMVWVDRQGHEQPIGAKPRAYEYPRVSPDGTKIAVNSEDEDRDIWIWDLAKLTLSRLTFGPANQQYPTWMPDGRSIVFSSSYIPRTDLFRKASDGTGSVERFTKDVAALPQSISPDGKWLVTNTNAWSPPYRMGLLRLQGGGPISPLLPDTKFNQLNGALSPDGRWIAYQSDESGQYEVYVRPFPAVDSGRWQISIDGGQDPVWSRNGRELYFLAMNASARLESVAIQAGSPFSSATPQLVFDTSSYLLQLGPGRGYDVAPDGRFLFLKATNNNSPGARQTIVVVTHWFDEVASRVK